jgi:hypothetical protein
MRVFITSNGCNVAEATRPAEAPPTKEDGFQPPPLLLLLFVSDGESFFVLLLLLVVVVLALPSFILFTIVSYSDDDPNII